MKSYEGLFILPPESGPEARKQEISAIESAIKKFNGTITNKAEWGRKPLGYIVKKFKEGYFLVWDIQLDPSKLKDLRDALQLQGSLVKYMLTIKQVPAVKKSFEKNPIPKVAQSTAPSH